MLTLLLIFLLLGRCSVHSEDKIYDVLWSKSQIPNGTNPTDTFNVTTSLGENYCCLIPQINQDVDHRESSPYKGPAAVDFIGYLFNQGTCSYRFEDYWTYELCHGQYIRQYHELLFTESKLKLHQYSLGTLKKKEKEMILRKLKRKEILKYSEDPSYQPILKKIGKKRLPFVEIPMSGGSPCEFNRKKKTESKVYYVCDMRTGDAEIYSIREVKTCTYEVVVFTRILCAHPRFRTKVQKSIPLTCYNLRRTTEQPHSLTKIYAERKNMMTQKSSPNKKLTLRNIKKQEMNTYSDSISDFLSGKNCINGGTGEVIYEFCYGKYLKQYSYGIFGFASSICLGKFNMDIHLKWLKQHPYKRPKPVERRSFITQFYSKGSLNNFTGKPRQTEVKMKCMEDAVNWNGLMMYVYEPNVGEYIFGIESPIICHLLPLADEDGLIQHKN